ncbi:hypothetical protein CHARACLAT_002826 [Characodon lateralis]|uniref:Uncharacterized protein n=1 Tax=Characodon lateralis TaxID=208331 RepID=A0ABU7F0Q9_9TELE|nr:hypothetical protein [Characodon lateralis]
MTNSQVHLTLKLKKLLVEKLNRANQQQLQSLMGPEFLKGQSGSELKKADILKMTVCSLRRMQQSSIQQVEAAAGGELPVQRRTDCYTFNKLQSSSGKKLLRV